jgi:radical SAM-linked protein
MLVLTTFTMGGTLRFLSHAETLSLFQRAFVRAGINLRYSRGFNPRPKTSLPLPRSVGVRAEEDLLCAWLDASPLAFDPERFRLDLSAHLPQGLQLNSVQTVQDGTSFHPQSATYVFEVRPECLTHELTARAETLNRARAIVVSRHNHARARTRNIDLRPFLEHVELGQNHIAVRCKITDNGSVRVAEILEMLGVSVECLDSPVRRTDVSWQERKK